MYQAPSGLNPTRVVRFDNVTNRVILSHRSKMVVSSALRKATTSSTPGARVDTRSRILEAAFSCVADVGLARTTMDDVARGAGVSRQTVYRYYASKDQLVMALVLREEEKFLDGIREAFARDPDLEQALEDGLLFCLRFAREHPLLDRLLATDPETLLPYLTIRARPMIQRAREVMVSLVSSKTWVRADVLESAADAMV